MARHRKSCSTDISDEDLIDIDEKTLHFHAAFVNLIAPLMKSVGKTIKYHRLSHVPDAIRRLGNPSHYDAQFFEAKNSEEKVMYKRTTGRTAKEQHLEGMVLAHALREIVREQSTFDPDNDVIPRNSAYIVASQTGEHAMVQDRVTIRTHCMPSASEPGAHDIVQSMPDFQMLREALSRRFNVQDIQDMSMPDVLTCSTAVLAAKVPWSEDSELQTVRATADFHRNPYYDCIAYKQARGAEGYAQLRMLFSARDPASNELGDYAFVRKFSRVADPRPDCLQKYGCIPLRWSTLRNRGTGQGQFTIINLHDILRRVYIVPDFRDKQRDSFHLCIFKWSRKPIQGYSAV
jgi:hypothetical protein